MSVLSGVFLLALPLVAAPILLHLFDRRRNVTIDWGAMEFLLSAATRRTSARKLKQWLLLALRVLALAALVLGLAQPMLPGNWFGSSDRSETILVVDNSMSTQRQFENTTLFQKLIERATAEIDDIKSGGTVRVLMASPYPVWATAASLRVDESSREIIVDHINDIQPTNGSSDLLAALFTAVQADPDPTTQKRRVVLLTDGQATDWRTDDENGWRRLQEVIKTSQLPTHLNVVDPEAIAKSANVAVNRIRSSRTVVGIDQPFSVTAAIQNHSQVVAGACTVNWLVGKDREYSSQAPALEADATHEAVWRHSFSEPGVYALSCQVDAKDSLIADNSATVVVEVVNEVPVLVVETAAGRPELQQDAFFLQAAMGWVNGEAMDQRGVHRPKTVTPVGLERETLSDYRAVVIPNLSDLSDRAVLKLKEFVFNGGGLWVATGPRADIEMFNQYFFADGDGLSPLAIDGIVTESDEDDRRTTLNPSLRDHPATAELANRERLDTTDVVVRRRFRFVPPPQDEDVSVLLSLTNGEPLAVERYVGRGRVIIQGIPLTMNDWSELARSQAYVVMVQDWMSYLTQPQATRHNLSPGDPITVHLSDPENSEAILKTPDGSEVELTADTAGEGVVFRSSRTIQPGNYSLQLVLSGEAIPFHVQRNARESMLEGLDAAGQQLLTATTGLSRNVISSGMSGTSQSNPVWPILFMLLLAFMTMELLLSGLISRERFGGTTISETSENFGQRDFGMPLAFGHKSTESRQASPETERTSV